MKSDAPIHDDDDNDNFDIPKKPARSFSTTEPASIPQTTEVFTKDKKLRDNNKNDKVDQVAAAVIEADESDLTADPFFIETVEVKEKSLSLIDAKPSIDRKTPHRFAGSRFSY